MQGAVEGIYSREEALFDEQYTCHVQARRKRIIRALGMVDVVVWMDLRFLPCCRQDLGCPVGDDLVHIHVKLRAAAGHPDGEREIAIKLAGENVVAGGGNSVGQVRCQFAQLFISQRGSFF